MRGPSARRMLRGMPQPRLLCSTALAAATAALVLAAPASAAQLGGLMKTYDLRLSVSMKSTFAFQPDPIGCAGRFPGGYSGSGEEVLEMRSPKPVRVTLVRTPGAEPAVTRKDFEPGFELAGETRRTGDFSHVMCDDTETGTAQGCTGRFPLRQNAQISFYAGKWEVANQSGPTTREAIPSCDDSRFDWDGAVARTGIVLLQRAQGAAPASKLKARSFTLRARTVEHCDASWFGGGSCATEWTYKANFRKTGKKPRHRH